MSHKIKTKPGKLPSPHVLDSATLAAQAEADLALTRYKEATELFKELLKRERRATWVDGLAACYAGRAHALAGKGMFKEALVLWRNRHERCGKPLAEAPYLAWLLQAGELGEAMRLLADPTLPDAMRSELEMRFAAMTLTWPDNKLPELSSQLPADSALLRHRPAALAALQACQQGDLAALDECLKAIPIRSPYRDLKPLLKALALLTTDRAAAAVMIARLPSNSPFERLAAVLRAAVLPAEPLAAMPPYGTGAPFTGADTCWLAALPDMDADSRQLLLDLKGCPDALRPLLLDLARLGAQPNPETWFDFLLRHRRALPAGLAANLCQRLLPHVPHRLKVHGDTFGQLTELQWTHIAALNAEVQNKRTLAMPHWQRMAELLASDSTQKQRAALIWRRLSGIDIAALGDSDADVIYRLKRSVELDPDERDTQLRLIAALRQQGELQQARTVLEQALPRFPKDAALLLEAVQVALASKAFKKAVGLAKQVLELDPINPTVRRLIGHAHFAHARKQIKTNNSAAAHKELDAAATWLRNAEDAVTLKLLRALACDGQTDEQTDARIREAIADLGGGMVGNLAGNLAGAFHLALEAGRLGMNETTLLKRGGVDLNATPAPGAMLALARVVEAAGETGKAVRAALLPLRPALKRAAAGRYVEADMASICEAFLRVEEYDLLRLYADAALKHWPQRPLFVYFKAASFADKPYLMPQHVRNDLDRAAEACQQNDRRTGQRIQSLFHAIEDEMPFADDDNDIDGLNADDPGMLFEMLLQIGGEELVFKTARQAMGKATFDALRKELGGSNKDFAHALVDLLAQEARGGGIPPPPLILPPFTKSIPEPAKPKPPKPVPHKPAPDNQGNLFDD
ncbi:MAG: tetratricopeptide repeat protein [Pseudomonadota bacterium]|nr:tetratricopeptide repeat protein [Pseudomonadota bacterium]